MGAIIRAACPCGYTSAEIFEGGGMDPKGRTTALATCATCRELVPVAVPTAAPRCPACRTPVRPNVADRGEWIATPGVGTLSCPRCGTTPLNIEMCGVWD